MKKAIIIFIVVLVLIITIYYMTAIVAPEIAFKNALKQASQTFPKEIIENIERIYRKETGHFKSNQFKKTYSPGMEKFSDKYPYGWNSLDNALWKNYPELKPVGFYPFTENGTGKTKYFIKFPTMYAAIMTVGTFLTLHNNKMGRWYSLKPESQAKYTAEAMKIKPVYANEIS
jgi:hypothetical protein